MAITALALSGCGGGSGGGGTAATSTTSTPTSVTTTATAPTATPTAPVAINYDQATDFTRDRAFNAIGVRAAFVSTAGSTTMIDSRVDAESAGIGFTFTAATRTYHLRYNDDMFDAPTQPTISGDGYSTNNNITYFSRSSGDQGFRYIGSVSWSSMSITHYLVFGARTLASDLPTTGTKVYTQNPATSGGSSIVVDFAARTVSIRSYYTTRAVGNAGSGLTITSIPVTMSGSLDPATGRISGIVSFAGDPPTGTFEGALYGPAAAEAALVFKVQTPTGYQYPDYGLLYSYILTGS